MYQKEESSMNLNNRASKQHSHPPDALWSYSQSGNDREEQTAVFSSIQAIPPRFKRRRNHEDPPGEPEQASATQEESPYWRTAPQQKLLSLASAALPIKPVLQMRPLSLERGAIAPGLARPTAPFAKSERKRAYVSAIYYSECFLRGIRPLDADTAAFDAQNQYNKWWIQSKMQQKAAITGNSRKKRKRQKAPAAAPEVLAIENEVPKTRAKDQVSAMKERLVEDLKKTGGDTTTPEVRDCLEQLQLVFASRSQGFDAADFCPDGTWLTLSKPTFSECQGRNENGEYLYTLGRMSFDMFRPTNLKCSIRAVMNNVRVMDPKSKPKSFPSRLAKELSKDRHVGAANHNPIRHYE
jgi:hypothetical protein